MSDGTWELQEAIKALLTGPLAPAEVVDHVPQGTTVDYVVIGDADVDDWGDKGQPGTEQIIGLQVYSRQHRGRKRCKDIADSIYGLLHEQPLIVTGQQVVLVRFESANYTREPDGLIYRGDLRYRVLMAAT